MPAFIFWFRMFPHAQTSQHWNPHCEPYYTWWIPLADLNVHKPSCSLFFRWDPPWYVPRFFRQGHLQCCHCRLRACPAAFTGVAIGDVRWSVQQLGCTARDRGPVMCFLASTGATSRGCNLVLLNGLTGSDQWGIQRCTNYKGVPTVNDSMV